jgi:hypothetical protein
MAVQIFRAAGLCSPRLCARLSRADHSLLDADSSLFGTEGSLLDPDNSPAHIPVFVAKGSIDHKLLVVADTRSVGAHFQSPERALAGLR